jgi:uncharacterized protein DUF4239
VICLEPGAATNDRAAERGNKISVAFRSARDQKLVQYKKRFNALKQGNAIVADWLLNLPVSWMALIVFVATYLIASAVYFVVTKLALTEWARAFKAVSPGILPPLGILFALLVGFIAVEVWNNFDKAKTAIASEASALRAVVLLAETFPQEQKTRIHALINRHIDVAVHQEWPEMAHQRATLSPLPTALIGALALAMKPADDGERAAHPEMVRALNTALDARRQRIVISESAVGAVKWVGILLQGLCTLVAIAMVHSDNRRACAMTLMLFATGIALSVLLIAAYSRPFMGENSVKPELLKQVIATAVTLGPND